MPVNFSDTVLLSGQDAFGLQIVVYPIVSQPAAPSYPVRGIWRSKPVIIETDTGYHSTTQATISIRLSEFTIPAKQNDVINVIDPDASPDAAGFWTIQDTRPDGQGKVEWWLQRKPSGAP